MIINRCPVCQNPIPHGEVACPSCLLSLERDRFDSYMVRCPKCAMPLVSFDYECRHSKFPIWAVSSYASPFSRRVLEQYKFKNCKYLAPLIASIFLRAFSDFSCSPSSLIVPVPSSPKSLKRRGWDQMKEVAKLLGLPYASLVISRKVVSEQKTLNRSQRFVAASNRFEANTSLLSSVDKTTPIVLIDDITTTGATLNAAFEILSSAGFSDVKAITWLSEL